MNEKFDTFKQNVANIAKRIVLDHIESHCLSIEQCHQLCEAGFPYFTNNMFLSPTALIGYHCNHGNITRLMDNTKTYDYLDKHYFGMYQKANQNIENICNDAINPNRSLEIFRAKSQIIVGGAIVIASVY